jgi:hypothetical protein
VKDATNYILTQLAALLTGNVSYSGNVVKFYSIAQDVEEDEDLFVNVTSSYIGSDLGSKDNFARNYSINLDVVSRRDDKLLSEAEVNSVSNDISVLICPTKGTYGIASNASFQIVKIGDMSTRGFINRVGDKWHIRKVLTLEILINQK